MTTNLVVDADPSIRSVVSRGLRFEGYDVQIAGDGLFVFSSRRRHTMSLCDWSSDVCSSDLGSRYPARPLSVGKARRAGALPGTVLLSEVGTFTMGLVRKGTHHVPHCHAVDRRGAAGPVGEPGRARRPGGAGPVRVGVRAARGPGSPGR